MKSETREIKCAWCGEAIPASEVKVKIEKNNYGTVIERRCARCNKVFAAYLEEEGDFFTKMRTF